MDKTCEVGGHMNAPCFNCQSRTVTCKTSCKKWDKYLIAKRQAIKTKLDERTYRYYMCERKWG